jgi:hypothetical protein
MEVADELNKNAEIDKIETALLEAIPHKVEIVNIIIALSDLASKFTWVLSDDTVSGEETDIE